jgi:hypothetical protein
VKHLINYTDFINEYNDNRRSQILNSSKSYREIISEYASWYDIDNVKTPIYRGINANSDFLIVKPSEFTRKSVSAEYYDEILNTSPMWKDFPKRNKSIICTLDKNIVLSLAVGSIGQINTYRVIPLKENSKFGVGTTYDIKAQFDKTIITEYTDPYLLGFKVVNYNNNTIIDKYKTEYGREYGKEVWTDADCLLVKESLFH